MARFQKQGQPKEWLGWPTTTNPSYSSVPNNCVGWNKCAGWNFHLKLINVQAGIIVQVGKILNI